MRKRRPWFRKAPPLGIELLEDRVTPAAIFNLWAGTLTVAGSDNADAIFVNRFAFNLAITVNNDVGSFAIGEIIRLQVNAKAGNDVVMVGDSVTIAVWISGGPGDDLIHGGSGSDVLEGDAGNDRIEGAAGNDLISGGFGDDTVLGGAGDDEIDGDQSANPTSTNAPATPTVIAAVTGEAASAPQNGASEPSSTDSDGSGPVVIDRPGNDQLIGDSGDDTIRGGEGDDLIVGGTGNDQLFGETGNDRIRGGTGTNLIDGGPGADRLIANSRKDMVNRDSSDASAPRPQIVVVQTPTVAARTIPSVDASNVDELLASVRVQSPAESQQVETGSGSNSGPAVATGAAQSPAPFEGPFEAVPATIQSDAGVRAGMTDQVEPDTHPAASTDSNAAVATVSGPAVRSESPISEQIDLVLNAAVLTEATSDGPDQASLVTSRRARGRPALRYVKPIPFPDLIPDITLPA